MPCTYYESPQELAQREEEYKRRIEEAALRRSSSELPIYKKELDQATKLLCGLVNKLYQHDPILYHKLVSGNKQLAAWWASHQSMDARRLAAQKSKADIKASKLELKIKTLEQQLATLKGRTR